MNTKFARFVFILVLALGILGTSTSAALADKPEKYEFPWYSSEAVTGMCEFPVTVDSVYDITVIDFHDKSESRQNIHFVAQDTFTANGITIVGSLYKFNWIYTSNEAHFAGIAEKIHLPDGSLFISAGWTDLANISGSYGWSTDKGRQGDLDAFCASFE